jgi:TRAP-type C4-dicarboxylate transport system permease small subunit
VPTPPAWVVRFRQLIEVTTVALFASYCVIILFQVFFRYVLNDSLIWSEETVRFEQFWVTMLATGLCAQRRVHIRLEGIETLLPARIRKPMDIFGDLVTIACCCFLGWYGVGLMLESGDDLSPAMQLPMTIPFAAVPVGSALTIFWTVLNWIYPAPRAAHA